MPDERSQHKLTEEAKADVLQCLCEGQRNGEVVALLKERYGVSVTEQAVDYYRGAYADEIDTAREEALKRAAQQGFANRLRRLAALSRKAEKLDTVLDAASVRDWEGFGKEFREFLKDIRDELGDLKQRHEHGGPEGGPIPLEHGNGLFESILGNPVATDAAVRLAHALGNGDADAAEASGDADEGALPAPASPETP